MSELLPRSIRNNNILNVRKGDDWQGMATDDAQTDDDFIVFVNPVMGLRAAMKILSVYYTKHGLNTVSKVITRWAPQSDNNPTDAYANHVAHDLEVNVDDIINLNVKSTMIKMTQSMSNVEAGYPRNFPNYIHQENPYWYSEAVYEAAWDSLHNK